MPSPQSPTTAPPQPRAYLTTVQKIYLIRFLEFVINYFIYCLLLYYLNPAVGFFIVKFLDEVHRQYNYVSLADFLYPDNPLNPREQSLGVTFTVSEISATAIMADLPEVPPNVKLALAMPGERDCSVCLETFVEGDICRRLGDCKHVFHSGCVDRWLARKRTCPVCRTRVESAAVSRKKRLLNRMK